MQSRPWATWLSVLAAVIVVGGGLGGLLYLQNLMPAAFVALSVGGSIAYFWLIGGIFAKAQRRYILLTLLYSAVAVLGGLAATPFYSGQAMTPFFVVLGMTVLVRAAFVYRAYADQIAWRPAAVIATTCIDTLFFCYACRLLGYPGAAIAIAGILAMVVTFTGGLWLVRQLLSPGIPVLGVARTLIDEAIRMRIAIVFIIMINLLVPVLPYLSDPDEYLKYRIGTFLAWSIWASDIILSLMTVFLACWTICNEARQRQIYLTLTKPIGRAQYLLGKWLGIALLNLLLLGVGGCGIYAFARIMQTFDPRDEIDRQAVSNEVLTARQTLLPTPARGMSFADLALQQHQLLAKQGELTEEQLRSKAIKEHVKSQALAKWHTIPHLGQQTYVFSGLEDVAGRMQTVQLKIKPSTSKSSPDERVYFQIYVNGQRFALNKPFLSGIVQVLPIPTAMIDDLGDLEVTIRNEHPAGPSASLETDLSFTPEEGLALLYSVGSFGPNLVRAMLIIWLQLCFLTMVALAAGTFLGFPVASLFSMMIYFTALSSGFLSESLGYFAVNLGEDATAWQTIVAMPGTFIGALSQGDVWGAVKVPIRIFGEIMVFLVPSFSRYDPAKLIADGQWVSPRLLGEVVLMVGLLWTGLTGVIGYLIFRRRELATVTV